MTVLAVEGSFASVIGGAPAAAVVFAGDVDARTAADARVTRAGGPAAPRPAGAERAALGTELAELRGAVRSEKLGEVAAEFDGVHSIQRAVEVGSVDAVIAPPSCGRGSSRRSRRACADTFRDVTRRTGLRVRPPFRVRRSLTVVRRRGVLRW